MSGPLLKECSVAISLPKELATRYQVVEAYLHECLPALTVDRRVPRVKLGNIKGVHTQDGLRAMADRIRLPDPPPTISLDKPDYHTTHYGGVLSLTVSNTGLLEELYRQWSAEIPDLFPISNRFHLRPHLGLGRVGNSSAAREYRIYGPAVNRVLSGLRWTFPIEELGIWGKDLNQTQASRRCIVSARSS